MECCRYADNTSLVVIVGALGIVPTVHIRSILHINRTVVVKQSECSSARGFVSTAVCGKISRVATHMNMHYATSMPSSDC